MNTVLLKDGTVHRVAVHVIGGAALIGEPTAYAWIGGRFYWLVPGESVEFMEA
jgi:hypothetical protein